MKYPAIRDICDVALTLTGKQWCWYAAFVGLAFNNYAIMGESNSLSFAPALTL